MKQLYIEMLTHSHSRNSASFMILFCLWVCLSTGCTSLRPNFETPAVGVTSFKSLTSENLIPQFEIGMRVVNPNATKLSLRGMSYKVFLNDSEVVTGATNVLPEVPAYGEAEFKVIATIGLIEGIRFVGGLLQNTQGQIAYRIQTKLDIGAMDPVIRIDQTGSFSP
ncbi:MAG: LEA14-like dessication related protein [Candidatus Nitrotoga sp. SPKER]|nr:MAG: LEA14-like dessication related protein [Candidatus Nitrotoga sp. SPKER]